jgi:hypothetical protein
MAIERVVFRAWGDRFVRPGGDSGDGALEAISPGSAHGRCFGWSGQAKTLFASAPTTAA